MASYRPHILVIEPDQALQTFIQRALQVDGYVLQQAASGAEGLALAEDERLDLVLVSAHLPDTATEALIRLIRERQPVPIIVIAHGDSAVPATTQARADTVLVTPSTETQVLSSVRSLVRQRAAYVEPDDIWSYRGLHINLHTHAVTRHNEPIVLSRTDWSLLELFVRNAGQILTHRMLLQQVWGASYSDEHGYLRTYINRLRMKLEDDPKNPQLLLTEPRIGYRWVSPNRVAPAPGMPSVQQPALPNVLLPSTSFLGREQDLATVRDLLDSEHVRLLTLTGPGGVGKTRLALQLSAAVREDFADGVCFVALAAVQSAEHLVAAIAKALHAKETADRPLAEQVAYDLQGKHMLLVLDNFEQLLPAAPHVSALLAATPGVKILVTSRAPLRLYGEQEFRVQPLVLNKSDAVPVLLAQPPVMLFADRARASQPDFALTAENVRSVAEICQRVDGLPLAIELAAAWVRVLPPHAIAVKLANRLAMLSSGARDLPARHRNLRNTLDWSYDLLEADQQALFAQLAVFVGGATLEAIEGVCGADFSDNMHLLTCLRALIDASLVQLHLINGEPRYSMLAIIRDYAYECLERGDMLYCIQHRHTAHFLRLADTVATRATPGQCQTFDQLECEHDNLRAAFERLLLHGEGEKLLRVCSALWNFWHVHGHQREGRHWLAQALALATMPSQQRAIALYGVGWLARDQGDYHQASAYYRESLALFRTFSDQRGIAEALRGVGELELSLGRFQQAAALFSESLELSQTLHDAAGTGWSFNHLGRVALEQAAFSRAQSLFEASLAVFQETDVATGIAWSLHNLGRVALEQGDYQRATTLNSNSLLQFQELSDKTGIAWSLHNLGRAALEQAQAEEAQKHIAHALTIFEAIADQTGTAWSYYSLGRVALLRRAFEEAQWYLEHSLGRFHTLGDQMGALWAFYYLRTIAIEQHDDRQVLWYTDNCQTMMERLNMHTNAPLHPSLPRLLSVMEHM